MDKSKFYNKTYNVTKGATSLILEYATPNEPTKCDDPVYTIDREDKPGYPSLYKLYMQEEDLTEWEFADKHLAGWDHWMKLLENKRFHAEVTKWRIDLEQKLKSRAFKEIKAIADEGGKNAFEANKIILNGRWKEVVENEVASGQRGRPKKVKVEAKTDTQDDLTGISKSLKEDLIRVGLLKPETNDTSKPN